MADEVYDGAIGIDLGTSNIAVLHRFLRSLTFDQVPHTLALPTMRVPMSRSVCLLSIQPLSASTNAATVANEQGSFTTPSFVSFTDEERLIGEAAKNQAAMNPANTVFDVKSVAFVLKFDDNC
jgi:molecular chaperone DnaK (HSP70)